MRCNPLKINEVEALVGITRKNIRFYEAEGLLSPRRNSQNGYRDYGETEVEVLRRIKLLRKLGGSASDVSGRYEYQYRPNAAVWQGGMKHAARNTG